MKTRREKRALGMPALELVEEATALVKSAPAALLTYYLFTVPFIIGLLFYWAEMSGSVTASETVSTGALGVAVLFVVMKTGQARFACAMRERLAPGLDDAWTPRRWIRCAVTQAIWQPWGILILPLAAAIALPFPYAYGFYQSLLVTGSGSNRWSDAGKKASKLAAVWPRQSFVALVILSVFGFVLYLNGWILVLIIPALIKMLLGVDSVFASTGYSFFNSTFLSATVCFMYLTLDPLLKSVYVLRSFYAESRQSGADLQADLRRVFVQPAMSAVIILLLLVGAAPTASRAQEPLVESDPRPVAAVPPPVLDESIKEVLNRREYRWRLPPAPETAEPVKKGVLSQFVEDFFKGVKSFFRKVTDWFDATKKKITDYFDKLFKKKKPEPEEPRSSGGEGVDWGSSARGLAWVLLIVVCVFVAVLLYRVIRSRQIGRVSAKVYTGAVKPPDLEDEHLLASELPEDEWLKLGDEMLRRGERRLALRAYYLAVIARLSSREFVTVAPHKTNRDYAKEVRRRARGHDDLIGSFGTVMSVFERVWYGEHAADEETWDLFETNRRIIFIPAEEPAHV